MQLTTCQRCGEELKVITVRVQVGQKPIEPDSTAKPWETWNGMEPIYHEEEQVCDCPRCHGAY